jgi:hypothetical protein
MGILPQILLSTDDIPYEISIKNAQFIFLFKDSNKSIVKEDSLRTFKSSLLPQYLLNADNHSLPNFKHTMIDKKNGFSPFFIIVILVYACPF